MVSKEKVTQQALEFLKEHDAAVLATVSPEGEPQAATVYYAVDDDFTFYFVTTTNSKKYRNLEQNPRVAVVVGVGPEPITVQIGGKAELVEHYGRSDTAERIYNKISLEESRYWPIARLPDTGEFRVYKVVPEWLTFLNLDIEHHPQTYQEAFYQIIP